MESLQFLEQFIKLHKSALPNLVGRGEVSPSKPLNFTIPKVVLLVVPHPDDEVTLGAVALRLALEHSAQVYVFPFSLGSDEGRKVARSEELDGSLKVLGFKRCKEGTLKEALRNLRPDLIISTHFGDQHPTHSATFTALKKELEEVPDLGKTTWIKGGFWRDSPQVNLAVEITEAHATLLIRALLCHVGELVRVPYQLRMPSFWVDQVRLASERVKPQGSVALPWLFGQMYEVYTYAAGTWTYSAPQIWEAAPSGAAS